MNTVLLQGEVVENPTVRYTQAKQAILRLRIKTTRRAADKEHSEFHTASLFGSKAEDLSKVLCKGSQVFVEGRLSTRSYEDKEGRKVWATEVSAFNVFPVDMGQAQPVMPGPDFNADAPGGITEESVPF